MKPSNVRVSRALLSVEKACSVTRLFVANWYPALTRTVIAPREVDPW